MTGDGILPSSMLMYVFTAILIVIRLLLLVISFGPVPPMHHVHTSEKHHYSHDDDHDTDNDFSSLITHRPLRYKVPFRGVYLVDDTYGT